MWKLQYSHGPGKTSLNLMFPWNEMVKLIMFLGGMNIKNDEVLIRTGMRFIRNKGNSTDIKQISFINWENFLNLAKNLLMWLMKNGVIYLWVPGGIPCKKITSCFFRKVLSLGQVLVQRIDQVIKKHHFSPSKLQSYTGPVETQF